MVRRVRVTHLLNTVFVSETHRHKLLEADLVVLVGVPACEGLDDLPHLVPRQGEARLSEQLLQLEVAHKAAVINV